MLFLTQQETHGDRNGNGAIEYRFAIYLMRPSKHFIESLSRGLAVLSLLSDYTGPLTLTQLSKKLGLTKSAIQRITFTLQRLGYIDRDARDKTFRLGPRTLSIGFSVMRNLDLKSVAYPYLEETSKESGETVNLGVLDGNAIVYVEKIVSDRALNVNVRIGSRLPLHSTSIGKTILAFLPEGRREKLLKEIDPIPYTSRTITKKNDLKIELEKIRNRGFATTNEEMEVGVRAVAAPIRNVKGEVVAAVNIAVPSIRVSMKRLEMDFAERIIQTANCISFVLGYQEPIRTDRGG